MAPEAGTRRVAYGSRDNREWQGAGLPRGCPTEAPAPPRAVPRGERTICLDARTAGNFVATGTAGFASRTPDMANRDPGTDSLVVTGQVNNLVNPVFLFAGGTGRLGGGDVAVLFDFGALTPVASASALPAVFNDVAAPGDAAAYPPCRPAPARGAMPLPASCRGTDRRSAERPARHGVPRPGGSCVRATAMPGGGQGEGDRITRHASRGRWPRAGAVAVPCAGIPPRRALRDPACGRPAKWATPAGRAGPAFRDTDAGHCRGCPRVRLSD